MEIKIKLNEYELTKVLADGTLKALADSINTEMAATRAAGAEELKKYDAQNDDLSDKKATKGTTAPKTEKMPAAAQPAPQPEGVSTTDTPAETPEVKLEDVRAVLASLTKAGKSDDVKALFAKYGASKLPEVKKEHYADLLQEARAL